MTENYSDKVLLLGYPIDRIPREGLEQHLLGLIEASLSDHKTKYATTLTALFLGQLSGLKVTHRLIPEITDTLRKADFLGINSKELQVLVKLLGNTIESRVTPEDLLRASASLLAKYQQSLFLLGSDEEMCKQMKDALLLDFPGLKISGAIAPEIHIKGIDLENAVDADALILEMIHEAKPAILALHLNHPKQDLWFQRIRSSLKVPLVIGIGGAFDQYLERRQVPRKEKKSLFSLSYIKANGLSLLRYGVWLPPLLLYNAVNHFLYNLLYKRYKKPVSKPRLFLSNKESLFVVSLPAFVNRHTWNYYLNWIESALEHENIIIDFDGVRHINPAGLGLLDTLSKKVKAANKNLFFIRMTGDIQLLLKLHGAWDVINSSIFLGPEDVLEKTAMNQDSKILKNREFLSISQFENQTTIGFFGDIQRNELDVPEGFNLDPVIVGRDVVVDLSYCTSISNTGLGFLLRLRELQARRKLKLFIVNANPLVKRQFKYFKLTSLFHFE